QHALSDRWRKSEQPPQCDRFRRAVLGKCNRSRAELQSAPEHKLLIVSLFIKCLKRIRGMKTCLVSRDPVSGNLMLSRLQIDLLLADHLVKTRLEGILGASVPDGCSIRLW